jgi:NAD-dependent dihydropyrimidine dehydrogenase PreA subunit
MTFSAKNMKRYNPINISGYHISEAGSSPLHEAAFTLANLIVYVEEILKTGISIDEFAPRLAFSFVCQADFFEEIAKFRALRRCYAKIMKERFSAKNPDSMRLRFPASDIVGLVVIVGIFLTNKGRLKGFAHRWQQALLVNPDACEACGLCVEACPERALPLVRV